MQFIMQDDMARQLSPHKQISIDLPDKSSYHKTSSQHICSVVKEGRMHATTRQKLSKGYRVSS